MKNSHSHWSSYQERGNAIALKATSFLALNMPLFLLRPIVFFVVGYFYLTAKKERQHIQHYQLNLMKTFPELQEKLNHQKSVFEQFYQFGLAIVDRFAVWQKRITMKNIVVHDEDNLYADMAKPSQKGQIFICSHLGNVDIARALVEHHQNFQMTILMHSKHAVEFNRALQKAGESRMTVMEVSQLDIDTMMNLQKRVEKGEWIAIAADRTPVQGSKCIDADFLGQRAAWPQGPWILASLLKVPVNTLFCFKEGRQYHLHINRLTDQVRLGHGNRRLENMKPYVDTYATILAEKCRQFPWQWFNFYHFWESDVEKE